MCRDHYTPRRSFFARWNGATAPRWLPGTAFTGRRRTFVFDEEGNVAETVDDDYKEGNNQARDFEWIGETWLEVHWAYLLSVLPHPDDIGVFTDEIRALGDGGEIGVHTGDWRPSFRFQEHHVLHRHFAYGQ